MPRPGTPASTASALARSSLRAAMTTLRAAPSAATQARAAPPAPRTITSFPFRSTPAAGSALAEPYRAGVRLFVRDREVRAKHVVRAESVDDVAKTVRLDVPRLIPVREAQRGERRVVHRRRERVR